MEGCCSFFKNFHPLCCTVIYTYPSKNSSWNKVTLPRTYVMYDIRASESWVAKERFLNALTIACESRVSSFEPWIFQKKRATERERDAGIASEHQTRTFADIRLILYLFSYPAYTLSEKTYTRNIQYNDMVNTCKGKYDMCNKRDIIERKTNCNY